MFTQLLRSRGYMIGLAIGQIWLTVVGVVLASALWSVASTTAEMFIFLGGLGIVGVILLIADLAFLRHARRLPRNGTPESVEMGKRMRRQFVSVVVIEVVVIAAANILLIMLKRTDLAIVVTLFLVGLHFIPLALVFHVRSYLIMGMLWTLVAILTLLVIPSTMLLGVSQTAGWVALPLIGCGVITLGAVALTLIYVMPRSKVPPVQS